MAQYTPAEYVNIQTDELNEIRVVVSPRIAQKWLETTVRNRGISDLNVIKYRNDMVTGRWKYDASPIRFDNRGHLIDGQHRLTALASLGEEKTDWRFPFLVVTGLQPDSQLVMDQGRRRTAGGHLSMTGISFSNNIAAGIRFHIQIDRGFIFRDNKYLSLVTNSDIQDWYEKNTELVSDIQQHFTILRHRILVPSVAVAAFIRLSQIDQEETVTFFERFTSLADLPVGHPIILLRRRLENTRGKQTRMNSRKDQYALLIHTWNLVRQGRIPKRLDLKRDGAWTRENFPEPV